MRRRILAYDPRLKSLARKLRNEMTLAEVLLWRRISGRQMCGYDFNMPPAPHRVHSLSPRRFPLNTES